MAVPAVLKKDQKILDVTINRNTRNYFSRAGWWRRFRDSSLYLRPVVDGPLDFRQRRLRKRASLFPTRKGVMRINCSGPESDRSDVLSAFRAVTSAFTA